jgi:type IV pilus assembly protein PilO
MALRDLQEIDFNDIGSWPLWMKISVTGVLCIAILAAGYWFIIKDQYAELQKLQRQEAQLKDSYLKKKALAINLSAYRQQMEEIEETFGVMLKQLPDKTEVPELLIDITQAGLGRGLQFKTFKPQRTRQEDFYAEMPISLAVSGTYHQLGEFVSDLASLPRIVTIGDLNLTPIKGTDRLTMSATTKTYHYLDEDQVQRRKKASADNKKQRRRRK